MGGVVFVAGDNPTLDGFVAFLNIIRIPWRLLRIVHALILSIEIHGRRLSSWLRSERGGGDRLTPRQATSMPRP